MFRWDNDTRTVLIYQFERAWTWEDLYRVKALADAAIMQTGHRVDVKLSDGFISGIVNFNRTRHPQVRAAIVVTPNALVRAMFNTIARLYKHEFTIVQFVATLDAARTLLAERQLTGE